MSKCLEFFIDIIIVKFWTGNTVNFWSFRAIKNSIAFIEGERRFVVKNKHLMINEFPVHQSLQLTPSGYAERGFSWVDGVNLIVSRAKESEWSNNSKKRPLPMLFHINLINSKQEQITFPQKGKGDFMPTFLQKNKKIAWVRAELGQPGKILIADQDGQKVEILVEEVGDGRLYEDYASWSKVISFYE